MITWQSTMIFGMQNLVIKSENGKMTNLHPKNDADLIARSGEDALSILVTADLRIERNAHEFQAWNEAERPVMILKSGWLDMPFWRQMNILTKSFPKIIGAVQSMGTDQQFAVMTNGKIAGPRKRRTER